MRQRISGNAHSDVHLLQRFLLLQNDRRVRLGSRIGRKAFAAPDRLENFSLDQLDNFVVLQITGRRDQDVSRGINRS